MLEYWWRIILKNTTNYEDETPSTIFTLIDIHNKLYQESSENEDGEVVGSYIDDI